MRERRLERAAAQHRVDRGRREPGVAEIELGGGKPDLRIDIVQSGEVDLLVAPGLTGNLVGPGRVRRSGGCVRCAKIETLEVEIHLDQRLAGEIGRSPAVEPAVTK